MATLDELMAQPAQTGTTIQDLMGEAAPPVGGFTASAKQAVGATIKGAGQLASDIGLADKDNALKQYGQEVIEANPTAVGGFRDILDKPGKVLPEAVGNAAGSLGTMLGIRAVGQGITAAAPLTGVAAPFVAGAGQLISWAGPAAVAALPSFGGIREKQIEKSPEAESSWTDKAIAALGAGTVGLIETKFGPQDWALKLTTEAGRKQLSGMLASETIKGAIGKGAVKGALIEGGEELVQSPIEQLASGDSPLTPTALEETAFGGVMGAVGGGVLGGGLGPALRAKAKTDEESAAQATNTVQAETLNQATPDEVKIDKVEDGVATVTVGDRTVDLPIKEAAEAVAKGNLEEVLAEKEAKPVIEELPTQPSSPTSTFLRQDGETRGFLPPTGKTIDDVRAETSEMTPAEKLDWFKENKASNYRYAVLDKQEVQDDTLQPSTSQVAGTVPLQEGTNLVEEQARGGEVASPSEQAAAQERPGDTRATTSEVQGLTETVSPAQDTPAGTNYSGEPLFDRSDGSRYRIRSDRKDRPGGYPDFGGDLAPVEQSAETTQGVNDEFTVPEQVLPVDEPLEGDQAVTPVPQVPTGSMAAPVQEGVQLPDGKGAVASFEALDTLSETATKQTITTGDLFTTLEQSPDENVKKLGSFLKSFTPGSKLESAVKVDPAAKTAGYLSGKNEITVKDLKNAPTSLHELVHSVTVRELKVRPDMQKRLKEVMALVKVQVTKAGLISKDTISNIEIAGGSKTFKNKFLAGELSGMEQIGYGLLNEQEFLAQAFSSPQFQGVLKSTQIKTGGKYRSAWDALVEKVMQVLGIEAKHASAFSEALSIAAQLASTDVSGTPLQAQSTKGGSTFVSQVQKDLKSFLGKGYDNLVKRGKLEVVRNEVELGEGGEVLRTSSGKIAGSYFPNQRKVVLFSDNLAPGDVEDIMRHEAGHALLKEDKLFRAKRSAILKDFAILARNNPKIKEAFARVPKDTAAGFRGEEALMYWLQEPANRKHSLFKRIISAVKAALYRLGIAHGLLSESDLVALFSQGTKAWSRRTEDQVPTGDLSKILARLDQPEQLFSVVSDKMKAGQVKLDQILDAVQDPKSRLRDIYIKYAKQWLAVMPRSHLAQTLGKKIHWLKDIDNHNKKMEAIKAQLPDDFYAIYQDAERIADKNSGLKAFNNLLLTGTFNQMTPWLDETEQDWFDKSGPAALQKEATEKAWKKEGMAKSTGKTFAEAYQEVRTAWDKLKPAEQEQVKKIVDYLASLRERERNNLLAVIEASSEGNPTLREQLMTQFNATFGKLRGIYVPLSRYGEYILKFTTKDGREQTEFFTSPGERRAFRKQMEAQGVDPDTFVEDVKRETQKGEAVIPQALREQLGKALEAKYLTGVDLADADAVNEAQQRAADAFSDLNQVILRWMPETSALKNSIHRKNVLGASTDMLRSSMDYVLRHAGSIAWMEYGRKIEADIQGFEQENKDKVADREGSINMDMRTHLVNDARRWFQAVKNERVSPIASTLGKFSTAYYMTSPSTFLVQLTQLPVLTLPALARKFASLPKATAALSEGLWKAFNKKYSKEAMYGDADVNRVYADLHLKVTEKNRVGDRRLGEDFFSPAEMLQKIKGLGTGKAGDYKRELLALRESLAKGDLDISAVHEASDIAQGKQTTAVGKILRYAMLPMQHGELGSRKATVLASYKLATDAKKDFFSALEDSSEIVGGTLYNYAKSDKGWFMQGDTVRTLTTFQTYRIKTALRMGILLMQSLKGETPEVKKEAFKEFLGVTAMSAALAGVHGTIIGGIVFGLANLFGGDDDEPYDAEMEFDNWVNENAGSLFGGIISYGLPTAVGVNASKRIGMGDLYGVSSEPPENMHGAQLAAWYAGNLIGPSFSVAQSWVKGYDQMVNKGNFMRGLEEALPKPLKDGLKAFRVASDGLKTGAGKKILSDEAIGPDEILMIGLGFRPDEVAKAQGAERSLNKIGTQLSERRGRLIRDAAKAIVESEDTEGPMSAIATFNAKLPLFAINGSDLRPAVRKLVLGEVGTTGLRQRQIASQFGVPVYQGE